MSKVTIQIDDTNPAIVAAFGADTLNTMADQLGYMEMAENPDHVPAVGSPTIPDMDADLVEDPDTGEMMPPEVANPDYVAPVGEAFVANTQTKEDFVAHVILDQHIIPVLIKGIAATARKEALAAADESVNQAKAVIKAAASINEV